MFHDVIYFYSEGFFQSKKRECKIVAVKMKSLKFSAL